MEPVNAVSLPVNEGLFSLGLGDNNLASMPTISPDVFANSEVYLRVWFSSDGSTFEQLMDDQRILVVGYAMEAAHAEEADVALNAWNKTGNAGTTPGMDFLGTTDYQALELKVNGQRAMRLEPNSTSPNIIGGYHGNNVAPTLGGQTIGGGGISGHENQVNGSYCTISGGHSNTSSGVSSTVSGGASNEASDVSSSVGGGEFNIANRWYSSVGGGAANTASEVSSTVGGGMCNTASGISSTVGGGENNEASGDYSTVPGGQNNVASGAYSFAGGRRAKAKHDGSFVWGNYEDSDTESWEGFGDNQFIVNSKGHVCIRSGGNQTGGSVHCTPHTGAFISSNNTGGGYVQCHNFGVFITGNHSFPNYNYLGINSDGFLLKCQSALFDLGQPDFFVLARVSYL